jgi:hypothetical protein
MGSDEIRFIQPKSLRELLGEADTLHSGGNPIPLEMVREYLKQAHALASSPSEALALHNAELMLELAAPSEQLAALFVNLPSTPIDPSGKPVTLPPVTKKSGPSDVKDDKFEQLQDLPEITSDHPLSDNASHWRDLVRTELHAALCTKAPRYRSAVSSLNKSANALIAAIAGYTASAVGFQAAIVAALVASVGHLVFSITRELFCAAIESPPALHSTTGKRSRKRK